MTTFRIFQMFIDVRREEEVEISELRSTPCKRKTREKFVTPSSRRRVLPSPKKKTREAEREKEREIWERGRERGRERDKGNTGLASTQFPSLASNFRRILPSHSILPLYQRVSLHLSQLSRPSSPLSQSLSTSPPQLSLSSCSRRILCIPLVSQPPLSVSVNASHQISRLEIEIHGIRVVAAHCNLVSKLKPAKCMRRCM